MRQSWLLTVAAFYSASVFLSSARADENAPAPIEAQAPQMEVLIDNQPVSPNALQKILGNSLFQRVATQLGNAAASVQSFVVKNGTRVLDKVQKVGNKEFNRYNLRHTFDLDGNSIKSSKAKLKMDASYQVIIKPSFVDGEQLRQDIFTLGLGTYDIKLAGNISLRFTFSRVFSGPKAKWDALTNFEFPFTAFWKKVPFKADDFKDMKDDEMVRLELLGKIGPEFGKEEIKDLRTVGVKLELYKEAIFAVDAQKVNRELFEDRKPRARLRFLALKNAGAGKFTGNVGTTELLKGAPSWLRKPFSIGGSLSFLRSIGIREPLPIDTMMVDYLFRFENDQKGNRGPTSAEAAVDEIYSNFLNAFTDLINPTVSNQEVSKRLLSRASLAEKFALEDVDKKLGSAARVRHLFKGRVRSHLQKTEANGELTKLNKRNEQTGTMNSHVTSVDVRGNRSFYILENSFARSYKRSGLGNRNQIERLDDYDFLIASDENEGVGPLMDIVSRTEIKEKVMETSTLSSITNRILSSLPKGFSDANKAKIMSFFPTVEQTNGHIVYQFNYGDKALKAIGAQLSSNEITLRTWDYILNNPRRKEMYLAFDQHHGELSAPAYHEIIDPLAIKINKALAANTSNEERLLVVRDLKHDPLFNQWLVAEFFPSLVPDDGAANNMGLTMQFKSLQHQEKDEATRIKPLRIGASNTSTVYDTIIFLRSVINGFDTFDMRLDPDKDGKGVAIQQLRGFVNDQDTNEPDDETED